MPPRLHSVFFLSGVAISCLSLWPLETPAFFYHYDMWCDQGVTCLLLKECSIDAFVLASSHKLSTCWEEIQYGDRHVAGDV